MINSNQSSMLLHMDHFSTFPDTKDLDEYLKKYSDYGFVVSTKKSRHHPGLLCGFVLLSGEYFQFSVIEDDIEFFESTHSKKDLIGIYDEHRPYSIGYVTNNINDVYEHWRIRGYQVEDVVYLVPRDYDSEIEPRQNPTWTYIPFPSTFAQGSKSYVIEYKKRKKEDRFKFIMGNNGIYAINGITLVSDYPQNRGEDWSNFFYAKNNHVPYLNECVMDIPPHFVQWLTPQKFTMLYKTPYVQTTSRVGELYVIHLLSKDIKYTKKFFENKQKQLIERRIRIGSEGIQSIILERDKEDGFLFAISEMDPNEWMELRYKVSQEEYR